MDGGARCERIIEPPRDMPGCRAEPLGREDGIQGGDAVAAGA